MIVTDHLRAALRTCAGRHAAIKRFLQSAEANFGMMGHAVGKAWPSVIRARPRKIIVAVTAHCNLRCTGCRYGRDFMPGEQLPYSMVSDLLADAKAAGVESVRLYGGEPLLHRDLPAMIERSTGLGLSTYVTTNGILLKQKIDQLYNAGLRKLTIGFYGTGADYDHYVDRVGRYRLLEQGIAYVRNRYGSELSIQLNFLLMQPSCSLSALHKAWDFAERYDLEFQTDLIHYSLPYFTEGPNRELQFTERDRDRISEIVTALLELKLENPTRMKESVASICSIPSWLLKGSQMEVPCDARKLIWVGADGTVKLCYVTFILGNLYDQRLRDMLFTDEHHRASQDAFSLKCPHCHCERESRIMKHLPSRIKYGAIAKELQS